MCVSRVDTNHGKIHSSKLVPQPTRHRTGLEADALRIRLRSSSVKALGSDFAFPSKTTCPASLTTHTEVSFCETSTASCYPSDSLVARVPTPCDDQTILFTNILENLFSSQPALRLGFSQPRAVSDGRRACAEPGSTGTWELEYYRALPSPPCGSVDRNIGTGTAATGGQVAPRAG